MTTIAVIGKGRTGGEVLKLLAENESPLIFDQHHPVSAEVLRAADVAIIFVPGAAVSSIFDQVLDSCIPAVWGSTGFAWPEDLNTQLCAKQTRWVVASNFSPMMVLIQNLIETIGKTAPTLIEEAHYDISEVHHVHKKDSPSGTALSWQEWLHVPASIHATREGDVRGIHELTLSTPHEVLSLRHEVLDRSVFAAGALQAARVLLNHPEAPPGLYSFYDLFKEQHNVSTQ